VGIQLFTLQQSLIISVPAMPLILPWVYPACPNLILPPATCKTTLLKNLRGLLSFLQSCFEDSLGLDAKAVIA